MATQRHNVTEQSVISDKVESVLVQQYPVNLDEVGNAEAVLQRMIHEKKTLENAAQVLATYRRVRSQVQSEQSKLVQMKQAVIDMNEQLADAELKRDAAVVKGREQVAQLLKDEQTLAMQTISTMKQQITGQQDELKLLQDEVSKLTQEHATLTAQYTEEIRVASEKLDAIKAEQVAIASMIGKAAQQFTSA